MRQDKKEGSFSKRRVLLIGGAGYIGSVLTGDLLEKGYRVRCLDLFLYQNKRAIAAYENHPDFDWQGGDFTDESMLEPALRGITDVVVLAGLVGDPITRKYPVESQKINEDGILKLFEALHGRKLSRVVFVSTCSNYGLIEDGKIADENYELKPLSAYAKAKVFAEKKLLSLRGHVDYAATILRFATAFGLSPRMRFDLTVNEFMRELYFGKCLQVYDAHTWRPYCHVRDFSRLIGGVLEAPLEKISFEVFNAGGDANNFTKEMIVNEIRESIKTGTVEYKEKGSDPRNYKVDFRKVSERLAFTPEWTVRDGIQELLRAFQNRQFEDIESQRNFYGNYHLEYEIAKEMSSSWEK